MLLWDQACGFSWWLLYNMYYFIRIFYLYVNVFILLQVVVLQLPVSSAEMLKKTPLCFPEGKGLFKSLIISTEFSTALMVCDLHFQRNNANLLSLTSWICNIGLQEVRIPLYSRDHSGLHWQKKIQRWVQSQDSILGKSEFLFPFKFPSISLCLSGKLCQAPCRGFPVGFVCLMFAMCHHCYVNHLPGTVSADKENLVSSTLA